LSDLKDKNKSIIYELQHFISLTKLYVFIIMYYHQLLIQEYLHLLHCYLVKDGRQTTVSLVNYHLSQGVGTCGCEKLLINWFSLKFSLSNLCEIFNKI